MKADAAQTLSRLIDLLGGLMSLPAIVVVAVGLAALHSLALLGGVGLCVLRASSRADFQSRSDPHRPSSATHHRY